jgi:hypothetical protein
MRTNCVVAGLAQKQGPASAATEGRANSKSLSTGEGSGAGSRAQQIERRFFAVAHGRVTIGSIEQPASKDLSFLALTAPDRHLIRSFPALQAAADAIDAAYGGAH